MAKSDRTQSLFKGIADVLRAADQKMAVERLKKLDQRLQGPGPIETVLPDGRIHVIVPFHSGRIFKDGMRLGMWLERYGRKGDIGADKITTK